MIVSMSTLKVLNGRSYFHFLLSGSSEYHGLALTTIWDTGSLQVYSLIIYFLHTHLKSQRNLLHPMMSCSWIYPTFVLTGLKGPCPWDISLNTLSSNVSWTELHCYLRQVPHQERVSKFCRIFYCRTMDTLHNWIPHWNTPIGFALII